MIQAPARSTFAILCCIVLVMSCPADWSLAASAIHREDLFATSDAGIQIHIREVRTNAHNLCQSILLVHGARVPGVASFDLSVAGGSLAADLAEMGFCVYVMDVRGYGKSTRPPEMEQPAQDHPPIVRSLQAVHDIDAAVELIQKRTGGSRVSLFGWATGSDMEDPAHPGRLNPSIGAYRCNGAESLLGAWNRSIPVQDKDRWRDLAIADAYVREALASDPETNKHNPTCFRSPNGPLEDSFYLATGRQLWDASLIYVSTLVLASEHDFWSRPADRDKIMHDLVHATLKVVVIPNATHFVHLDRPEHGRSELLHQVMSFVQQN
jgi:pimeloyl-ACP methyl ester carboxylesterase